MIDPGTSNRSIKNKNLVAILNSVYSEKNVKRKGNPCHLPNRPVWTTLISFYDWTAKSEHIVSELAWIQMTTNQFYLLGGSDSNLIGASRGSYKIRFGCD